MTPEAIASGVFRAVQMAKWTVDRDKAGPMGAGLVVRN